MKTTTHIEKPSIIGDVMLDRQYKNVTLTKFQNILTAICAAERYDRASSASDLPVTHRTWLCLFRRSEVVEFDKDHRWILRRLNIGLWVFNSLKIWPVVVSAHQNSDVLKVGFHQPVWRPFIARYPVQIEDFAIQAMKDLRERIGVAHLSGTRRQSELESTLATDPDQYIYSVLTNCARAATKLLDSSIKKRLSEMKQADIAAGQPVDNTPPTPRHQHPGRRPDPLYDEAYELIVGGMSKRDAYVWWLAQTRNKPDDYLEKSFMQAMRRAKARYIKRRNDVIPT